MSGELIRVGDTAVQFLVTGSDSGGSAAVFEATIRARGRMPAPHSHDGFEETVYGLEGVSTWTVDGAAVDVAAGDALCIRRGAVHHFDNHGDVDAKALCVITPGLLGPGYFHEVAAVFAASAGGPPDLARIGDVMRRHGLTPAACRRAELDLSRTRLPSARTSEPFLSSALREEQRSRDGPSRLVR